MDSIKAMFEEDDERIARRAKERAEEEKAESVRDAMYLASKRHPDWEPLPGTKERDMTEKQIAHIAEACHEMNRIYCDSVGDFSQTHWSVAEQWQRDSSIKGVTAALSGATPRQLQEAWKADKVAQGWVWGAKKDGEAKTHPCIVDYDDLPDMEKRKDALFAATVRSMVQAFE